MVKNSVAGKLTSVDELFTTQAERVDAKRERVVDILLEEISDFRNHPFKVRQDEAMMEMAESVRQYGVLVPALVRPKPDGGYEMVAGHRRKMACALAGRVAMPCVVRELTDDEAIIIMVDSNLQRETVLPSEKAFAYKMKLEAMRRRSGRPSKENLTPLVSDSKRQRTNEILGESVGESREQIRRYIRLTQLVPELLERVDDGKVALRPAVELSYLAEEEQRSLLDTMECEDCTPSHVQAIKMRKFSEAGNLTDEVILSIMQEEKPNQKEQFKMPKERIARFFPAGTPAQKIEDTIVRALDFYRKRQRDMER